MNNLQTQLYNNKELKNLHKRGAFHGFEPHLDHFINNGGTSAILRFKMWDFFGTLFFNGCRLCNH